MSEVVLKEKKKIHIRKWVYFSLSILINAFIMLQAALPATESVKWSNLFVRFFTSLFNGSGKDTTEVIKVSNLELNYDSNYSYNFIEGYDDNEIVVGKVKRLNAVISPASATNTAVSFKVSDTSIASITQNQNLAYITGLKAGIVEVTATSLADNTFVSKYSFNIVEPKAPITYTVSDASIYQGSLFYLPITCDNEDYYDLNKLEVNNSNPSVINKSSDYEGLYYASSVGTSILTISDKSFTITVNDSSSVTLPSFTKIDGVDTLYSKGQASYQVQVSNSPTNKDVYWEVSNPSLASINKNGILKINEINEESKITITAHSLLDKDVIISKEITLKPVTITDFELVIPYYGTHITNMPYMGETGEEIKVWIEDNTGTIGTSGVTVTSSNPDVAKVYAQGSYIYISCIKDGNTHIEVTSINNPSVMKYIDLQVTVRGVINHDNYLSFAEFVRKSIGHFLLFLVSGVFTFLYFYELNKDVNFKGKKKWYYIAVSLVLGVLLAGLSELIQVFVPSRFGSMLDVLTDSSGYILGALITLLVIYLIHHTKNKKKEKLEKEKE